MKFNVPIKSLKRWLKVGHERKKGGGRKTKDPNMEKQLYQWYLRQKEQGIQLTARMVKDKAKLLSKCPDFIASKGWLDKFKIRFRLDIAKELGKSSVDYQGKPQMIGSTYSSLTSSEQ